jgi:iron complex transport system ATP-binding protein
MTLPLECSNLQFAYHRSSVVQDVSLTFAKGEFVGLIGPNGAGKSTLLKLLLGLNLPEEGWIKLFGKPLDQMPRREVAQKIAFVPQDISVHYAFSVREIVAMGRNPHLGAFQTEQEIDRERIEFALEKTDLRAMAHRRVDQLSGGERQRVFIARALAQEAPVLLLDEPTSSLDLCHQLELLVLVRKLKEEGYLVIAALHDLELASRYCNRLVMLSEGRVVADGSPKEVLTSNNLRRYFSIEARVEAGKNENEGLRLTVLSSAQSKPAHF